MVFLCRPRRPKKLSWGYNARVANMCPSTQLRLIWKIILNSYRLHYCISVLASLFLPFANALPTRFCRGANTLRLVETKRGRGLLSSEGIVLFLFLYCFTFFFNYVGLWRQICVSRSVTSYVCLGKNIKVILKHYLWHQFSIIDPGSFDLFGYFWKHTLTPLHKSRKAKHIT